MAGRTYLKDISPLPLKGYASNFFNARTIKDLLEVLSDLERKKSDYYFLGGGYNTLYKDRRINLPIITCIDDFFYLNEEEFIVSAFCRTSVIGHKLFKMGVSNFIGIETIPGTIGAGIKGNASYKGFDFYQGLKAIYVYQDGSCRFIRNEEIRREYRQSSIRGIILLAIYKVKKDPAIIEQRKSLFDYRLKEQDTGIRTLGSTFKNPTNKKAYELIASSGIKRSLKSVLSSRHANFLSLTRMMSPRSLFRKLLAIQNRVKRVTGETLAFEIKVVARDREVDFSDAV